MQIQWSTRAICEVNDRIKEQLQDEEKERSQDSAGVRMHSVHCTGLYAPEPT
jgi:hypothetical protein